MQTLLTDTSKKVRKAWSFELMTEDMAGRKANMHRRKIANRDSMAETKESVSILSRISSLERN